MISYLISTRNDFEAVSKTIASFEALAPHDYEVVICGPQKTLDQAAASGMRSKIITVLDDKQTGSTYGFNHGAQYCNGDWIVISVDDSSLTIDIERVIMILGMPEVQLAEHQVYNFGAGWFDTMARNHGNAGLPNAPWDVKWAEGVNAETMNFSYPVICFPVVSKKTMIEKLDGVLFNDSLLHHYPDHWLGAWIHRRNPGHQFNMFGPNTHWWPHSHGAQFARNSEDMYDGEKYVKLLKTLVQDDPNCRYNISV